VLRGEAGHVAEPTQHSASEGADSERGGDHVRSTRLLYA
jgi:hypothetical protein